MPVFDLFSQVMGRNTWGPLLLLFFFFACLPGMAYSGVGSLFALFFFITIIRLAVQHREFYEPWVTG